MERSVVRVDSSTAPHKWQTRVYAETFCPPQLLHIRDGTFNGVYPLFPDAHSQDEWRFLLNSIQS